jgi:amino acid adenylation domain-containing protein
LADEPGGRERDEDGPLDRDLALDCVVLTGRLTLRARFSGRRFRRADVESFVERWRRDLEELIAHCVSGVRGVTPSDFPLARLTQAQLDQFPAPIAQVADIYPLSPMQEGILFHSVYDAGAEAYLNQLRVTIEGLDVDRFHAAWRAAIRRHDVLRAGFLQQHGLAVQWVAQDAPPPFVEHDFTDRSDLDDALTELARVERARGFDLAQPPLMRFAIVRTAAERHHVVWTVHHLLLDGWSTSQLLGEVLRHYRGEDVPSPGGRFRDYIAWLRGRDAASSEDFWRARLRAIDQPTLLAGASPKPASGSGYGEHCCELSAATARRLTEFARRERVTLNTLVQAAWIVLLQRCTGQDAVVFGATVAGRPSDLPGAETLLGLFINTLPVIGAPSPAWKLGDWLRELQTQNLAAREHEHVPLVDIQRWAGQSGRALFDSLLAFENYPLDDALRDAAPSGLKLSEVAHRDETHYPMTLSVVPTPTLCLRYAYARDYFDADMAASIALRVEHLLDQFVDGADRRVGALTLASEDERRQLLSWGRNDRRWSDIDPVHRAIERRAQERPEAVAVLFEDEALSYAELNGRANRLAHRLRRLGVGPETAVGVAVERSPAMVIALLAVMKAGGAYVPLDPDYPQERLAYMAADSGLRLLLTQERLLARLPADDGVTALALETLDLSGEPESDPDVALHGDNLVYVIYTSGSTGRPKGAANRHRALANRLAWMQEAYQATPSDTVLQKTPLGFDVSAWEVFWPLMCGARLALARPGDQRDPARLAAAIRRHGVTLAHFVPSMLPAFLNEPGSAACASLRRIVCSGEALSAELQRRTFERIPWAELVNLYGPTEAAIEVTHWTCVADGAASVPIGRPISGTQTYVLDGALNLAPAGAAGELYLGGEGLARGYLGRAALTAERFVADPFGGGGRLYRTGDLARWRADGQLEYLGRIDHQVKLRGLRIELGEIEAQLLGAPDVAEAAVVVRPGAGGGTLIAYVVAKGPGAPGAEALRERLARVLPDYMVPSAIVTLAALPLTPNGKLDRSALPAPTAERADREAPVGALEQRLAAIWAEVLSVSEVGRNDNFFALGGDSILALQIVARLRRAGWTITPREVFERQTVAELAAVAHQDEAAAAAPRPARGALTDYLAPDMARSAIEEREIEDVYPLSPTQEGMLFHALEAAGGGLYVNQLAVDVWGLDPDRLVRAWGVMVERHPTLRTAILCQPGLPRPLQVVLKSATPEVSRLDWRGLDALESRVAAFAEDELRRPFDLLAPPLARLALLRLDDDRHRLVWTRHHILSDGWTDSRLIGEWLRCYAGETLPPPGPGFGDYVRWLGRQDMRAAETFWKTELAAIDGPVLLSTAMRKPAGQTGFAQIYTRWSPDETAALQAFARRERVTLNTVIQAAWALLLMCHTDRDEVVFGVTVAGRPYDLAGSEDMLGLFISTVPLPVSRGSHRSVGEFLRALQRTNLRLREYEHTPLADIQRWAGSTGRPLFDSILVFENYPIDKALNGSEPHGLRFGETAGAGLTGYAMDLQVVVGDTLEIEYCYSRADFADESALVLRRRMERLLRQMVDHGPRPAGELLWSDPEEQSALLALGRNEAIASAPIREPIHRAIERQAAMRPNAVALALGERELTYAELSSRARRLAQRLIAAGVGPEMVVGVAMERSLDLVVTLLAVLEAGGAYVPLDLALPAERLAFIVRDAKLSALITHRATASRLRAANGVRTLALEDLDIESCPDADPAAPLHADSLAYVVYTSGSTGTPKGVAVAHGPLAMHCRATAEIYGIGPQSRELLFMSFSFDGAHERWLTALSVGATLALRGEELWTAEETCAALHRHGVTTAAFPPAYLNQIAEWAADRDDAPPVELYVFGGEAMPRASYDRVRQALRPRMLINGYGPTETVVTPLIWKTDASRTFDCAYAPIGRPVGERVAYVLDVDMRLAPKGVVGELYIGGYGLARGYLGRPGMTAERFVADPFDAAGGRLYRTGDLVRWMDDGVVEYVGRADHQVKIRGFRIELGEIEACIRDVPGVLDAAVVARDEGTGRKLAAYVVPAPGEGSSSLAARVKRRLSERLPDYMTPAHLTTLPRLPRLVSGKLDHGALPSSSAVADAVGAPPSTPEAKRLAEVWREVLGVRRIGEDDNFFELGGDSLLCLQLVMKMRALGDPKLDFKLRDVIQRPTIAGLLGLVSDAPSHEPVALNASCESGELLFCVHAGMGTIFDYQPLARRLQGSRAVLGLPCRMISNPAHLDASLAQMATDYCRMIRSVQPRGPYRLLGWSLGGALAALMAARLESEGERIAFLGLVDPFVPGLSRPDEDDWRLDLIAFVSATFPALSPDALRDTLGERIRADAVGAVLARLVERAADQGDDDGNGYAELGGEELARIFGVAQQLKRLSAESATLTPLRVEPHCWWTASRRQAERAALAAQLGQEPLASIEIDTDHASIMRSEALLCEIEQALSATAGPAD